MYTLKDSLRGLSHFYSDAPLHEVKLPDDTCLLLAVYSHDFAPRFKIHLVFEWGCLVCCALCKLHRMLEPPCHLRLLRLLIGCKCSFRARGFATGHQPASIAIPIGVSGASKFNGLQGWRVLKPYCSGRRHRQPFKTLIAHVTLGALIPSPPHPVAAGLPVRLTKA